MSPSPGDHLQSRGAEVVRGRGRLLSPRSLPVAAAFALSGVAWLSMTGPSAGSTAPAVAVTSEGKTLTARLHASRPSTRHAPRTQRLPVRPRGHIRFHSGVSLSELEVRFGRFRGERYIAASELLDAVRTDDRGHHFRLRVPERLRRATRIDLQTIDAQGHRLEYHLKIRRVERRAPR